MTLYADSSSTQTWAVPVLYVRCHHEESTWWAESSQLQGWSAAASTKRELDQLVREARDQLMPGAGIMSTVVM